MFFFFFIKISSYSTTDPDESIQRESRCCLNQLKNSSAYSNFGANLSFLYNFLQDTYVILEKNMLIILIWSTQNANMEVRSAVSLTMPRFQMHKYLENRMSNNDLQKGHHRVTTINFSFSLNLLPFVEYN